MPLPPPSASQHTQPCTSFLGIVSSASSCANRLPCTPLPGSRLSFLIILLSLPTPQVQAGLKFRLANHPVRNGRAIRVILGFYTQYWKELHIYAFCFRKLMVIIIITDSIVSHNNK